MAGQRRFLRADELAQIAGRAGRFRDDGTLGETADCEQFEEETIDRIVNHQFDPVEYSTGATRTSTGRASMACSRRSAAPPRM